MRCWSRTRRSSCKPGATAIFRRAAIAWTGAECWGDEYSRDSQGRVRGVQRRSLPTPSHAPTDVTATFARRAFKVGCVTLTLGAGLFGVAGCASVSEAEKEPAAKATQLDVKPAKFSSNAQLPGDRTTLSITVTNTGTNKVNDLIVTLQGTRPDQLPVRGVDNVNEIPQGTNVPTTIKRKAWFIDDGPGKMPLANGETWNGGSLEPGETKTLRWKLAAITPGSYTLTYYVAGGLTDNAVKATSGNGLKGTVSATIAQPGDDEPAS